MSEAPSRYHRQYWNGKTSEWHWDTTHPDLIPTKVIRIGHNNIYCLYCGNKALPIQAHLRNGLGGFEESWRYDTTGYTCFCVGCEAEKEFKKKKKEIKRKASNDINILETEYQDALKVSPIIKEKIDEYIRRQTLTEFLSKDKIAEILDAKG